jgi:hypothetical protein
MLYLLFLGFLVSFLGQLPLGNMSFTATQVGLQEGVRPAWRFAIGVAIVEMVYLRFALTGMNFIVQHRVWFMALGWLTVVLFLVLGILAFIAANKQGEKKALLLQNKMDRFLLGSDDECTQPRTDPVLGSLDLHLYPGQGTAGNSGRFQPVHSWRRYRYDRRTGGVYLWRKLACKPDEYKYENPE